MTKARKPRAEDLSGRKFERWTVLHRDNDNKKRGAYWICQCTCGNVKSVSGSSLRRGNTYSCGCIRGENRKKLPEEITYYSAHERVYRTKGKASLYSCVKCGAAAREWALSHNAVKIYLGSSRGRPVYYSGDPEDYEPRCAKCHRDYDREGKYV